METKPAEAIPRRSFLTKWSGSALLALVGGTPRKQALEAADLSYAARLRLEDATCADFTPHVGTRFAVLCPDSLPARLELIEVVEAPSHWRLGPPQTGARRHPFSLRFRGPVGLSLAQQTYRVRHSALGQFDLFLVPVGPPSRSPRFEAVFA